jgi:hypothetical protein
MEEPSLDSVADGPYQTLPGPEHIRLLKLEAGPPEQEYLSYVMRIFQISDPDLPEYYALSYTWGSPVVPADPDDVGDLEDATEALVQVAKQISGI